MRSKEKYGPNCTRAVDRGCLCFAFLQGKKRLRVQSRSELHFLLLHPDYYCVRFLFNKALKFDIKDM